MRQKVGAAFLLGWTQVVPWITVQVIPILAFTAWRHGGIEQLHLLDPAVRAAHDLHPQRRRRPDRVRLPAQRREIRRHRAWFVLYALHSMLWFGEFKNVISRVAQLKEVIGERQWRVTPRATPAEAPTAADSTDGVLSGRRLAS